VLFYRVLLDNFVSMSAVVYTPTVGWACLNYHKCGGPAAPPSGLQAWLLPQESAQCAHGTAGDASQGGLRLVLS